MKLKYDENNYIKFQLSKQITMFQILINF